MFKTWVGVVLLFVVFGLFVMIVIGAMPRNDAFEEKRAKARAEKLNQTTAEANAQLSGYGWVDEKKGVARIPIDRAMELTMAELTARLPMSAYAIATPAAAPPASAGSPSVAPVAPALPVSATPKPKTVEGSDSMIRGQPAGAANPPAAPPQTQPGPSATPAASPPSGAAQPNPGGLPMPAPVQSPPGTPIPVPGRTP